MDTPKRGIPLEGRVGQESLDGEGALFSSHNMAFNVLVVGILPTLGSTLSYEL